MQEFVEIPANKKSIAKRQLVCDKGINDALYNINYKHENTIIRCSYYTVWKSMLNRCYNPIYHKKQPTYKNCSVCSEWLLFSNFRLWMETQDWKGKVLDKDILIKGNKEYCSEKCIFVSSDINNLLLDSKASRGNFKIGVSWYAPYSKYRSRCNIKGYGKHLGYYDTEQEAYSIYCIYKARLIEDLAENQLSTRLKNALILRAKSLTDIFEEE